MTSVPSTIKMFVITVKQMCTRSCCSLLFQYNSTRFLYPIPNILSKFVDGVGMSPSLGLTTAKATETDMRYFTRINLIGSLGHKKNFGLICHVV